VTNIIKIALVSIVLMFMNGCTPATFLQVKTPIPLKSKIQVVVPKDKKNKNIKVQNLEDFIWDKSKMPKQLAETFYTAAIYGKQHGYSYFAITKKNTDNLSGFPINSFDEMLKYCQLKGKGHFRSMCWNYNRNGESIIIGDSVSLKVRYFKKPIPGLFLYNIDETIKQTEKIILKG